MLNDEDIDFEADEWQGIEFTEMEFEESDGTKKRFMVITSVAKDSPMFGRVYLTWILFRMGDLEVTPEIFGEIEKLFHQGGSLTFIVNSAFLQKRKIV